MNFTDILVETLMKSKLIHIEFIPTPCDDEIDWEATEAEKQAIYEETKYNVWAWCDIEVIVEFAGYRSNEYLSHCSYTSVAILLRNLS